MVTDSSSLDWIYQPVQKQTALSKDKILKDSSVGFSFSLDRGFAECPARGAPWHHVNPTLQLWEKYLFEFLDLVDWDKV